MSDCSDYRDTLYTIDSSGKRNWVYPQPVKGFFYKSRRAVILILMALLFALPWISFKGQQAVLLDIRNRKFTIFANTFWATDSIYLMLLLGLAALSLFLFTSLFGRVWCGWACPETVFLEFLFRPLEALIEGNANERRKLDSAPLSLEKFAKKSAKYLLFSAVAWMIASTILAYFFGREPLLRMMTQPPTENLTPFIATLILTGALLFQFGWFREQFCTVLCPYARLQSVLLDSNSLVIGYDKGRGEPRGKANKNEKLGDCVDCGLCVRVCPTGIDIRNGLQLECIQCAGCIDACNSIMHKLGRAPGLIRYDTETRLLGQKVRFLRPRVLVYAALVATYLAVFIGTLAFRKTSEFQIIRSPGTMPYSLQDEGKTVTNRFKVHFANKGDTQESYSVEAKDSDVKVILPGAPYTLPAGSESEVPLFISTTKESLTSGRRDLILKVLRSEGIVGEQKITILGPD